jgi:hypothetical protein
MNRDPYVRAGLTLLVATLVACGDSPAEPVDGETPAPGVAPPMEGHAADAAGVAVLDAVTRSLPALEPGGSTAAVRSGLVGVLSHLTDRDGVALERDLAATRSALERYAAAAPSAFGPDVEAIRLTLDAVGHLSRD